MATITSLGVGSGLPLQTTLDQLSKVEKQRLDPITRQQSDTKAQKDAYETLKTALTKYKTATDSLTNSFTSLKTSSSNPDIAVTTSSSVAPGKYEIDVTQLARAQSLATASQTSTTDPLGDKTVDQRTLVIKTQGSDKPLEIKLSKAQTSLEGIRDAINKSDSGISASIVKVDDKNFRLVIGAAQTGTTNQMTISVTGDDTLAKVLTYDGTTSASNGMEQLVAAQDAELTVNNLKITRPTNTITDAPQGMTLTLTKVDAKGTVTVDKNPDGVKNAVKSWVDSYNSLLDTIGTLTNYVPVDPGAKSQSQGNGPLLGDSTVMTIKTQIRSQFIQMNSNSDFKSLAEIGIATTDYKTGKLTLDEKKLDKVMTENPDAVNKLLVGDSKTSGIATNVSKLIAGYTSSTGTISIMEQSLDKKQADLKKRFDEVNASVNDTIARYKKQFTALDVLVKKMDDTSKYLTQQFDALAKSTQK